MKRPQRFTRHKLREYKPATVKITDGAILDDSIVFVKPNDLVVSEGTRGKYAQVLEVGTVDRQYDWVNEGKPFKILSLTLRSLFQGSDQYGLVRRTTCRPYRTATGWQSIVRPINQAVVDEINRILPYNLQIDLSGKLSERT
jgi:hypothetical protein